MSKKKIEIEIDIPKKTFNKIALMAHYRNITFNKMCNIMLKEEIEYFENL
jgi:hypothetical protein